MGETTSETLKKFKEKLDLLQVWVEELYDQNLDDRIKAVEEKLLSLEEDEKMLRTRRMMVNDHKAVAAAASAKRKKDNTDYLFQGDEFNKKELVLKCIKHFVAEKGITHSSQLIERFPPTLRRTYGVIRPVSQVTPKWERNFHMGEDDILRLSDGDFAVCSAWEIGNIGPILEIFREELGYTIEEYQNGRRKGEK